MVIMNQVIVGGYQCMFNQITEEIIIFIPLMELLKHYQNGVENMEIYAPDKSGKYEMEFLCIPNLSNAVINTEKEIPVISSNRYTLEVE